MVTSPVWSQCDSLRAYWWYKTYNVQVTGTGIPITLRTWCLWVRSPPCIPNNDRVGKLAKLADLKSAVCGFDSHSDYQIEVIMLDDILSEGIESVNHFGLGNLMFKTSERTYCLNLHKKYLMRFVVEESLGLNDEWFDETEVLSQIDYDKLIEVIKCM